MQNKKNVYLPVLNSRPTGTETWEKKENMILKLLKLTIT